MGLRNIDSLEFVTWGGTVDATDMNSFIIKDLHIKLTSDITITGSVVFINCIINMNNHSIYSKDTLILKNCSVSGDRVSTEADDVTGIFATDGYIQDCSLHGFVYNSEIHVKEIESTECFKCHKIICGSNNNTGTIKGCTFTKCEEIQLYNGCVHDCEFIKLSHLQLHDSILRCCCFEDSVCTDSPLITANNKSFNSCIFRDIVLLNFMYLVELHEDATVDLCGFSNIRTSRKDKQLFINRIAPDKKQEEYLTNCCGLEDVKNLEGE